MSEEKKIVFISGPFTGGAGPEANHAMAIMAGQMVADAGGVPFIPHLYMAWDKLHPAEYEVWMERCFAMLRKCDAIFRFPGASPGADREVALARELGLEEWQLFSWATVMTPSDEADEEALAAKEAATKVYLYSAPADPSGDAEALSFSPGGWVPAWTGSGSSIAWPSGTYRYSLGMASTLEEALALFDASGYDTSPAREALAAK